MLLLVVVIIRQWLSYIVTSTRVIIRNGYTQHEIASIQLDEIKSIDVMQGPIARFWGIGTLVIQSEKEGRDLKLRGVKDPDVVDAKLTAVLPGKNRNVI